MLFNSLGFALFLPLVLIIYWLIPVKKFKLQNMLLLVASYYFYACWDWRFLFLLIFSTSLDYFTGIQMAQSKSYRVKQLWFWISIVVNVGFLGVFKYYNFFAGSFVEALNNVGIHATYSSINVILPVGISFYTFHGLSYVIDIYNDRIKPERDFIHYSVFVSFFPLLVAGPIERATHLLPQITRQRKFQYEQAADGLRQILWGLFKKIVIADNCATYVNDIFANYTSYNGSTLLLGAVFFAFQIYGDFSGYSDIALGTARLFGIELLRNFAFPYFSRDIAEFWRRWHISLTTWFRDYIYVPLGGSRNGRWLSVRNTFIIFLISGFWHGANWTFIFWGFFHALLFMPLLLLQKNRKNTNIVAEGRLFPNIKESGQMLFTFFLVILGWVFFRAETLTKSFEYLNVMFFQNIISKPVIMVGMNKTILCIIILLFVEWIQRFKKHGLEISMIKSRFIRWAFYYIIIGIILEFGANSQSFIYFQF